MAKLRMSLMTDQRMPEREVRGTPMQRLAAPLEQHDIFAGCPHMSKEPKEKREKPVPKQENPAGPHARPELTEKEKTPGSGMLPEPDEPNSGPTS
jgi:hypothetical protein